MKILQLVNRIPYPLNDGGSIGIHYYTEGFLQAGVSLSMLAMNTTRHWVDTAALPPLYGELDHFEAIKVDNHIKPLDALLNLFKDTSYNIDRFISPEYEQALIRLLQRETFDVVQLEGLYVVPYVNVIRQYSKAKISIRQHNIEYRIWERLAARARNPLKKAYLKLLTRRLKQFELQHLQDYDLILPISREDARLYKALGTEQPMFLHPFGIEVDKVPYCPSDSQPLSLYHIGAMDWLPNQESVDWLLEKVMPLVRKHLPGTTLYLAGRNMPERYLRLKAPQVTVLGEVPDALAFERDKSILVVPLLSGGGVRIKIFQGMAMGKTIVTTPMGLEGIEAQDGEHVMLAHTPEDFVQRIAELVRQPGKIQELGAAARQLMEEKYDRKRLIAALLERYAAL
ncbi:glycosyltransferase family 4 protein [Taibaiella koreensis]|uniref:glycosyltransferase family 4 protein n=1 Tax=Taibaiella koreensis TaxID=1268548 RepID=UPI000E5A01BB|nr:glycosyltransferase family 4 protein [Taibaiella koreensis]